MMAANARIYAKYFTVHDLQMMTAFYRSPTGQKILTQQVALAADTLASMQPLMRDTRVRAAVLARKQAESGAQAEQSRP